nr:GDNF family receptor alpha-3 [Macaca nemestrina]
MVRPPSPRPLPPVVLMLLLLLLLLLPPPSPLPLAAGDPLPTESRLMNSCLQARRKCQADPICSAAYHHLDSCTSSISTPLPSEEPSVPADCLEAAQQLRNSSLIGCMCHRRMKNQVACLDIYWTVHRARSLGNYELDVSPYEDTVTSKPWKMNLSKLNMLKPDSEYGEQSIHGSINERWAGDIKMEQDRIKHSQNCKLSFIKLTFVEQLNLQRNFPSSRSRLVDFQTHCHPMDILGTCATEQSRCLRAYLGLIGTAMTPNFVSNVNTSVALSCTCRGSGNLQEECEQLEGFFSHNPCLTEAIAAKMRFHSQLFYQDWPHPTFAVMAHQNENRALRSQPWAPSLFSCTLPLILLLSLW